MNNSGRKRRRQIRETSRVIKVNDGDVILLKADTPMADATFMNGLSVAMEKAFKPNCVLVVTNNFDDISILDEKEMLKRGWVKVKDDSKDN